MQIESLLSHPQFKDVRKYRARWMARCPCHEDSTPSLSISTGADGRILMYCFAGCKISDILARIGLTSRDLFSSEDLKMWTVGKQRKANTENQNRSNPSTPTVNMEKIGQLARDWSLDFEHDFDAQKFLWQRRGISIDTARTWMIGVQNIQRNESGVVGATWTYPVFNAVPPRHISGIKFHRDPNPDGSQKCFWMPKGVSQTELLFPLLESFVLKPGEQIIVTPGELKALAYVSAGFTATSRTTGESAYWPQALAERFRDLHVILDPDHENSTAAKIFVKLATVALKPFVKTLEVVQP